MQNVLRLLCIFVIYHNNAKIFKILKIISQFTFYVISFSFIDFINYHLLELLYTCFNFTYVRRKIAL